MPGWAYGQRVDEVTPSFDVFSLGKVIWSMISGMPKLQLWYFDKPTNNLMTLFPEKPEMEIVNELLGECIVEDEENCMIDASNLLSKLDHALTRIEEKRYTLSLKKIRPCMVCAAGTYEVITDRNQVAAGNFGIQARGSQAFRIYSCIECGHVQLFSCKDRTALGEAWED